MTPATSRPRFGVWALEEGTFGALTHPDDPHRATWERVRDQVLEAERLGFDSTLVAQLLISPFGDDYDQLETWSLAAALAALTERIEIIAAIKPYTFSPAVLAKMALQIDEISGGRFAINVVNGWFAEEARKAGLPFLAHDERYAYGREWTTIVKDLLEGRPSEFHGRWFDTHGFRALPGPRHGARPTIYAGGESEPARELVADLCDVWFLNGQPIERVRELIADAAARPRAGTPIRYGMAAFVIARETSKEAADEHDYLRELKARDADATAWLAARSDPAVEMHKTLKRIPHIGSNGGTAAGLVGSYDEVAARIREFHEAGIELFMLQFQPFEAEMRRFAEHVMPRVHGAALAA